MCVWTRASMYERTNYAWEKFLVYSHDMLSDSDKIPLPWPLKIINVIRTSNQTVLKPDALSFSRHVEKSCGIFVLELKFPFGEYCKPRVYCRTKPSIFSCKITRADSQVRFPQAWTITLTDHGSLCDGVEPLVIHAFWWLFLFIFYMYLLVL